VQAAYDVQGHYVALLQRDAGAVVGYKIGLTSPRMQAMCGINKPICGSVLSKRVHASDVTLRRGAYGRLGLEFEIAVRLGADVQAADQTAQTVRRHVDAVCAGIEVVDDRNADYKQLDVRGLVADNAWNAGMVLSHWVTQWPELPAVEGVVTVDDKIFDRGFGRDVLGDPLVVVPGRQSPGRARERLKAGQVMTGSRSDSVSHRGRELSLRLAGIGSVGVRVSA
jgi:2-oxo-3-hexenedioate decarboxylase/2-keto-4-pentenoate hydratase